MGTNIHLPIKLTITIEEWDQRILFLVCIIVCRSLFVGFNFISGLKGLQKYFYLRDPFTGSTTPYVVSGKKKAEVYLKRILRGIGH